MRGKAALFQPPATWRWTTAVALMSHGARGRAAAGLERALLAGAPPVPKEVRQRNEPAVELRGVRLRPKAGHARLGDDPPFLQARSTARRRRDSTHEHSKNGAQDTLRWDRPGAGADTAAHANREIGGLSITESSFKYYEISPFA